MQIAFATFNELPQLEPDDFEVLENLNKNGIKTDAVIWNDPRVNWQNYSVVLIRSCWDYHLYTNEFLNWLSFLERIGVHVVNDPEIIRWNMYKTYLRDLEKKGIKIIPTTWLKKTESIRLADLMSERNWQEVVIKPVVSLGSYNTWRSSEMSLEKNQKQLNQLLTTHDVMIQEYQEIIQTDGEYSFIFLNSEFQFAIVKKPRENEFRVQEEFGGSKNPIQVSQKIIEQAESIVNKVNGKTLFARVDGVIIENDIYLMELELIDPSLYLNVSTGGINQFSKAIRAYLKI